MRVKPYELSTIVALTLVACASEPPLEGTPTATREAFGVSSCSTATADTQLAQVGGFGPLGGSAPPGAGGFGTGGAPSSFEQTSPSTYNTCTRTYVIDIPNLNPIFSGTRKTPSGRDGRIRATWKGPLPFTQAACQALWTGAIVYKMVGGAWVSQTGQIDAYGEWGGDGCVPPAFSSDLHGVVLEANAAYRLAVTMRSSFGSSTRYPIGYSTQVPY